MTLTLPPEFSRPTALLIALLAQYLAGGYGAGDLELQKLAYLLQVAGEPMLLDFVEHQYGPYADGLIDVLQPLEGHYIRRHADGSRRTEVELLPGAAEMAWAFFALSPAGTERLDQVTRLIEGFDTPYGLELLATVHWVASQEPAIADVGAEVVQQVREWSTREADLFTPRHIRVAWRHLREQGWLSAPEVALTRSSGTTL